MAKKLSGSSQRVKLKKVSGSGTYTMTAKMEKELKRLAKIPDDKIKIDEEMRVSADWSPAVRGKFYRPIKKLISIRLDMDILEWLKQTNKKYQTQINEICREYMESHMHQPRHVSRSTRK